MKRNKGFTLIELLGVIVILGIIVSIVLINLSKISEKNKESGKEKEIEQIKNAARDYFNTNQNYLTDLDNGKSVYVSVDALIKEDYLNTITDITTSKKFNKCDIVLVSKENNKLSYKYVDNKTAISNGFFAGENCSLKPVVINSVVIKSTITKKEETTKSTESYKTTSTKTSTTTSNTTKFDTEKPKCAITLKGKKGKKVSKIQWYKSDVYVELTYSDNVGVSNYDLSTSNNKIPQSFNNKKSLTQSAETKKITYYGYVKDAAGNIGTCNVDFALEKKVSMTLNVDETNRSDATNSKITSTNKNIFKGNSCLTYKNSGGSGNCRRKLSNGKYVGCADDNGGNNKFYFGKACEYVNDYKRTFNISSVSGVSSATYKEDKASDAGLKHIDKKSWFKSVKEKIFKKIYYVENLEKDSNVGVNFSKHQFQYISPAGNKSNYVIIYTEYSVDCGYPKY